MRAIREGLSQHYERKWQHHDGYWLDHYPVSQCVYAFQIERRNAEILAAIPDGLGTILDVGCGVGDLMLPLARKSRRVVGVDVAAANVRQARRNLLRSGVGNSALIQSGAEALPFRAQSFDAVVMADVIEHVPDVDRALVEARRVLRAGGVFICVTPHAQTLRMISRTDRMIQAVLLFPFR
ncbi:MAG: class I SAM-dependent methyltransferase, partial [Longimicrobiales bacterium]